MSRVIHINEKTFQEDCFQKSEKVLINFWAEWCGPCKFVNTILEELAKEEECDVYLIDVDKNPKLMHRFEIESIPNILFYSRGKLIDQLKNLEILIKKEEIRKKILA